jgi:hypothetical protein
MFDSANTAYRAQRQPGDFDLVAEVRNLLINAGASDRVVQFYDTNHTIIEASSKVPDVQRQLLNRYLYLQIVQCSARSTEERQSLIPNGSIEDWLRLFKATVLPFMVLNNLPAAI